MSRERWAGLAVLVVGAIAYGFHAASFGFCLQDDAYITLRFSRFLAAGYGPIYNLGEFVEGYTNFSWTLLCAVPFWLGLDPARFVLGLGYSSGFAALGAVALLVRQLAPDRPIAWGSAALMLAALPAFTAESVMGLETAGFAALAAAALACYLHERRASGRFPWSGAVLALAAWTRPEGVMIAGLIGLHDLWSWWRERPRAPFPWRRWLLFALPVAAHLGFRLWFYGDYVPNTFHAKVGGGAAALLRGVADTREYAAALWPLLVLAAIGAGWLLSDAARRRHGAVLAVAIPLIYVAYVMVVGSDYKPTFRFYATPSLFFAAGAGLGADQLASWLSRGAASLRAAAAMVLIACAAFTLWLTGEPARDFARWRASELPVHRAAGIWLGQNFPPETLLATGNAGVLPFESRLPTIDMYGLCDRHIARREMPRMGLGPAGHEKGDGGYVLDRRPAVILVMRARFSDRPLTIPEIRGLRLSVSEQELFDDPRFLIEYELVTERLPGFYFNFFRRRSP